MAQWKNQTPEQRQKTLEYNRKYYAKRRAEDPEFNKAMAERTKAFRAKKQEEEPTKYTEYHKQWRNGKGKEKFKAAQKRWVAKRKENTHD